jgi:AAA-like domain/CHAT domain
MNGRSVEKILILAANPLDTERLNLDREVAEIRTTLQLSTNRARFTIETRGSVRPDDLQDYMYDLKPQIVHFSGHGVGTVGDELPDTRKLKVVGGTDDLPEGLVFMDDDGRSKLVSGAALSNLFALFAKDLVCVVLNACYSQQQAEAIRQHIPYVVGMNQAIGDLAARKFSQGFYRAIWDGRSIEEAFASGQNAIELKSIPEELTPVLLRRSNSSMGSKPIDLHLEEPEGLVGLHSAFYIERPPVEVRCYEKIAKKGALIKIKAPQQMGKSSLMIRIRDRARQLGYKAVNIDFEMADRSSFTDLDKFLRWFCASIGKQLGLPRKFDEYWDDELFSRKDNCTDYLKSYLLKTIAIPIVLTLDKIDILFGCPIADDFLGLLRVWHEMAKSELIWENLRLIVVHSLEPSNINVSQSPFGNVGVSIELVEFDRSQVQELVAKHGLTWNDLEITKLMAMVGGHPYLIRVALYHVARQYISFDRFLAEAPTEAGIYRKHLLWHLERLRDHNLVEAMQQILVTTSPVRLAADQALQLDSMGLIVRRGNDVMPSCNLYRLYFGDRLEVNT